MGKVKKTGSGKGRRSAVAGGTASKKKTKLGGRSGNGGAGRQQQRAVTKNKKLGKKTRKSVREKKSNLSISPVAIATGNQGSNSQKQDVNDKEEECIIE